MINNPSLLLLLVLSVSACSEGTQNDISFGFYYTCAANKIDAAYASSKIVDRPAAENAIENALKACAVGRDRAFEAFLSEAKKDPKVKSYIQTNSLNEDDTIKLAESEFDLSIRNQLMENISKLHRADARGNNAQY